MQTAYFVLYFIIVSDSVVSDTSQNAGMFNVKH